MRYKDAALHQGTDPKMIFRHALTCLALFLLASCVSIEDSRPVASLASSQSEADAETKPNILWLVAEDIGDDWGVYGEPEAYTPNIDRIANKGTLFTNAFMTTPVCSTSRSALFTGVHASSFGGHQHRSPRASARPLPDGIQVLPHLLALGGYTSGLITEFGTPENPGPYKGDHKTDWNFAMTREEAFSLTQLTQLKDNQPFFAQVQFEDTHRLGFFDDAHQNASRKADPAKVVIPPYYPDHPITREDWAQYLTANTVFDDKVGYILSRLEEEGVLDNTIVFIFGDNGRAHVRGKQWLYDSGMRVPLTIYCPPGVDCPSGYASSSVSEALISGVDITATTLVMAGLEVPGYMHGIPFYGPDARRREFVFGARDRSGDAVEFIRSVRTDQYLYIRNFYPERPYAQLSRYKETQYPVIRLMRRMHAAGELNEVQSLFMAPTKPPEELYDVQADPDQINNLAGNPKYADVLAELSKELTRWQERTTDKGLIPENPEDIARGTAGSRRFFEPEMLRLYREEGMSVDLLPQGFSDAPTSDEQ